MQKNSKLTEKEIIIKNIESSKNMGEVAKKCRFSIATLYTRISFYEITDYKFKNKRGGHKTATLG